jgi:uncharacterized protein (DUF433 family)
MKLRDIITVDREVQNGNPVFKGTRVPVQSLFWHIESGVTIDDFVEDFPSVSKQQAIDLLEGSNHFFPDPELMKQHDPAAR